MMEITEVRYEIREPHDDTRAVEIFATAQLGLCTVDPDDGTVGIIMYTTDATDLVLALLQARAALEGAA